MTADDICDNGEDGEGAGEDDAGGYVGGGGKGDGYIDAGSFGPPYNGDGYGRGGGVGRSGDGI